MLVFLPRLHLPFDREMTCGGRGMLIYLIMIQMSSNSGQRRIQLFLVCSGYTQCSNFPLFRLCVWVQVLQILSSHFV